MTGAELLTLALLDAGVAATGQVVSGDMMRNAKMRADMMLASWSARRWMVYHLVNVSKTMTGALSYTLGTGGDFDTPWIDSIESAFLRQLTPQPANNQWIDYPLVIIRAREDYDQITLKGMQASPSKAVYLDTSWPMGTVYPWPVPNSNYALHLTVRQVLGSITLAADLSLPDKYQEVLWSNLVERYAMAYKLPLDPDMKKLAKGGREFLRAANTQIPTSQLPAAVRSRPRGGYNIYSDSYQ